MNFGFSDPKVGLVSASYCKHRRVLATHIGLVNNKVRDPEIKIYFYRSLESINEYRKPTSFTGNYHVRCCRQRLNLVFLKEMRFKRVVAIE